MKGEILDGIYAELECLQKQIFELTLTLCRQGAITIKDAERITAIAKETIDKQKENDNETI